MRRRAVLLAALAVGLAVVALLTRGQDEPSTSGSGAPLLLLASPLGPPVLEPGALKYGFESGRVLKLGATYHMFISEMACDPFWRCMRLAHWTSPDSVSWTRQSTLFESEGLNPQDPRDAVWSPIPVYDPEQNAWNLFYVTVGTEGRIWRAVSTVPGRDGIGGPYADAGIVMQRDAGAAPWEGAAGVTSFFPYRVGERWHALYGSANPEQPPLRQWRVGLATADHLAGPWRRMSQDGPLTVERRFIENPIVSERPGGGYVAVYDSELPGVVGVMYSDDGVRWRRSTPIAVLPQSTGRDPDDVRTPLGVVNETDATAILLFTGRVLDPTTGQARFPVFRSSLAWCQIACKVPVTVEGSGLGQFTFTGAGWTRGAVTQSATANDAVTLTFRGRGITLRGATGPDRGRAEVRVDGGKPVVVDLYTAAADEHVVWRSGTLGDGRHRLSVRVTGEKREASVGALVALTSVEIRGSDGG